MILLTINKYDKTPFSSLERVKNTLTLLFNVQCGSLHFQQIIGAKHLLKLTSHFNHYFQNVDNHTHSYYC